MDSPEYIYVGNPSGRPSYRQRKALRHAARQAMRNNVYVEQSVSAPSYCFDSADAGADRELWTLLNDIDWEAQRAAHAHCAPWFTYEAVTRVLPSTFGSGSQYAPTVTVTSHNYQRKIPVTNPWGYPRCQAEATDPRHRFVGMANPHRDDTWLPLRNGDVVVVLTRHGRYEVVLQREQTWPVRTAAQVVACHRATGLAVKQGTVKRLWVPVEALTTQYVHLDEAQQAAQQWRWEMLQDEGDPGPGTELPFDPVGFTQLSTDQAGPVAIGTILAAIEDSSF